MKIFFFFIPLLFAALSHPRLLIVKSVFKHTHLKEEPKTMTDE